MQLQNKLFIGGEFVDAEARGRIEVLNPHDNSKIADVAEARQADIDNKFLFWKSKIIDDPSAWRHGWSTERVRVSIRNFADEYGQSMLDAIKLIGGK